MDWLRLGVQLVVVLSGLETNRHFVQGGTPPSLQVRWDRLEHPPDPENQMRGDNKWMDGIECNTPVIAFMQ